METFLPQGFREGGRGGEASLSLFLVAVLTAVEDTFSCGHNGPLLGEDHYERRRVGEGEE